MSDKSREIANLLREISGKRRDINNDTAFIGKVMSVDLNKRTCVVRDDSGFDHTGVKLQANISGVGGFTLVPKTKTDVIVSSITKNSRYVDLVFETDVILINGDQYGGLVKAPELKKQIDKNTKAIKSLINLLKTWSTTPYDGGAALKASAISQFTVVQLADMSDIENKDVKHG